MVNNNAINRLIDKKIRSMSNDADRPLKFCDYSIQLMVTFDLLFDFINFKVL